MSQEEITAKDASARYPLSASQFVRLAKQGKIIGRLIGHTWVVDVPSVERYLRDPEARKSGPRKGAPQPWRQKLSGAEEEGRAVA